MCGGDSKSINPDHLPPHRAKSAYVDQNCFGITRDDYIYRIFSFEYLINDIEKSVITMACPSRSMHGDRYENALLDKYFRFEGSRYRLLSSMMGQYFCQSWSRSPISMWRHFQTEHIEVRIKCKVGSLMDALVRCEDDFYMLHYYLGKVEYVPDEVLLSDMKNRDFEDYLDSQGVGLLTTLLRIKDCHQAEDEVRLVYNRQANEESTWINANTRVFSNDKGSYCEHPMNWNNTIEEVAIDPSVDTGTANQMKGRLVQLGIKVD